MTQTTTRAPKATATTADIEAQLEAEQAALSNAASAGEDTAPIHDRIRALEDQQREAVAVREARARVEALKQEKDKRAGRQKRLRSSRRPRRRCRPSASAFKRRSSRRV